MPCYSPLAAYRSATLNPTTGKRGIVFNPADGYRDMPLSLPCGQCIGCRLEYSRQWAMRCMHEASLYDDNCFITLTYQDKFLPKHNSLFYRDFQLFMKRFRFECGDGIRFFMGGEYGEKFGRPHYHAVIFNYAFSDLAAWQKRGDYVLYRSPALERLWSDPATGESLGYASVGTLTFESAAYVARYCLKKQTGPGSTAAYIVTDDTGNAVVDPATGEIAVRVREFAKMSRNGGIGKGWYDKFKDEVYRNDSVIINGKEVSPPRYYDTKFSIEHPAQFSAIRDDRVKRAKKYAKNNTLDRLVVRETVKKSQLEMCVRSLD